MNRSDLDGILAAHAAWLAGNGGTRADLRGAKLRDANLRDADLHGADLRGAKLFGARLRGANLCGAKLCRANLYDANLCGADLRDADLRDAKLCGANLTDADLFDANLRDADLAGADFTDADLRGTCLDPAAVPNGDVGDFEIDAEYVIGYRTRSQLFMGGDAYVDGREYVAPVFSVAATECHPGLYLSPTEAEARKVDCTIRVRALAADVHRAGSKWRCRKFVVVGDA